MKFYKIIILCSLLFSVHTYAQVSIGTDSIKGALHLQGVFPMPEYEDSVNRNIGFILPKVDTLVDAIPMATTPTGGEAVEGTVVFTPDIDLNAGESCIKTKQSQDWSNCLADASSIDNFFDFEVFGGLNVKMKKVSAGFNYSMFIGYDDDAVYTMGINSNGKTGQSVTAGNSYIGLVLARSTTDISAGYLHSLAATTDGRLWSWGYGAGGRTGHNDVAQRSIPMELKHWPRGVKAIRVEAGYDNSMVLGDDGKVYTFGANALGKNGNGVIPGTVLYPQPITIPLEKGDTVVDISLSHYTAGVLTKNGKVYVWGSPTSGRLGNGTTTPVVSSPQPILTGYTIKQLAMGAFHGLALTTDNKLLAWGLNTCFGNPATGNTPSPIDITNTIKDFDPDTETIIYIAASRFDGGGTSTIITDKGVYSAGSVRPYRTGLGTIKGTNTVLGTPNTTGTNNFTGFLPIYNKTIYEGTKFSQVSIGSNHTLLLEAEGEDDSGSFGYGIGLYTQRQLGAYDGGGEFNIPTLIKK